MVAERGQSCGSEDILARDPKLVTHSEFPSQMACICTNNHSPTVSKLENRS
jgi:hypothetical protein